MQGVVLQTYGAGNIPDTRKDLIEDLRQASDRGVMIVNCTQCIKGHVSQNYAAGRVRYLMCCRISGIVHKRKLSRYVNGVHEKTFVKLVI